MIEFIKQNDKLYAQKVSPEYCESGTTWIGEAYEPLQGSLMKYDIKSFKTHRHILNPRIIKRTQEVFVVIKGIVQVTIYHEKSKDCLGFLVANAGEAIFVWDGFHTIEFLENGTVAYEIKAGQFTTVQEDKEFF